MLTPKRRPPNNSETRLYFARSALGELVDVTQVARGLECNCTCPGCGGPLLAKQGAVVAWHFAHAEPTGTRNCGETALHLAGKAALLSLAALSLPEFKLPVLQLVDTSGRRVTIVPTVQPVGAGYTRPLSLVEASTIPISEVQLEVAIGARRLDALVLTPSGPLGIEILVSHAVDEAKRQALALEEVPVLEIDLSGLLTGPVDLNLVANAVQAGAPRQLIANSHLLAQEQYAELQERMRAEINRIDRVISRTLTLSMEDAKRAKALVEGLGFDWDNLPPGLGWDGWLASRHQDEPHRLFSGTHHLVWQVALISWASKNQPRLDTAPFRHTLQGLVKALYKELDVWLNPRNPTVNEEHAISGFLNRFQHQSLPLFWERSPKGVGGWYELKAEGSDAKAQAFSVKTPEQKQATVERWLKKLEVVDNLPIYDDRQIFDVPDWVWKKHLWLVLVHGKHGQLLTHRSVMVWLNRRYQAKQPHDADMSLRAYLASLSSFQYGLLRPVQRTRRKGGYDAYVVV